MHDYNTSSYPKGKVKSGQERDLKTEVHRGLRLNKLPYLPSQDIAV